MEKSDGQCCFLRFPTHLTSWKNAMHPYELPQVHYTVVRAAKGQMGIGGDDSWGACTHPEYLLKVDNKMKFSFFLFGGCKTKQGAKSRGEIAPFCDAQSGAYFHLFCYLAVCLPKIMFPYLESAVRRIIPSTAQETTSPTPTVSIIKGMGRLIPYP